MALSAPRDQERLSQQGGTVVTENPNLPQPAPELAEAFGQPPLTAPEYVRRVAAFVGADNAAAVLARYRVGDHGSPSEAWAAVVTDAIWARPMTQLNRGLARQVSTYAYEFADRQAPWLAGVPSRASQPARSTSRSCSTCSTPTSSPASSSPRPSSGCRRR
jgi:hypothetical protein